MVADTLERTEVRSDCNCKNRIGENPANGCIVNALEQEVPCLKEHSMMADICESKNKPEGKKKTQSRLFNGCRWCFENHWGNSRISLHLSGICEKLWESRQRGGNGSKWKRSTIVLSVLLGISVIINIWLGEKLRQMSAAPSPPDASSDTCPCPQHWLMSGGWCYFFSDTEATWNASQNNCSSQGGSLLVLGTPQEWDFVSKSKRPRYYWIGLRRTGEGELWKWSDGSVFSNWFSVGGEGFCAYLSKDVVSSTWCNNLRYWICSKHLHGNTRRTY